MNNKLFLQKLINYYAVFLSLILLVVYGSRLLGFVQDFSLGSKTVNFECSRYRSLIATKHELLNSNENLKYLKILQKENPFSKIGIGISSTLSEGCYEEKAILTLYSLGIDKRRLILMKYPNNISGIPYVFSEDEQWVNHYSDIKWLSIDEVKDFEQ